MLSHNKLVQTILKMLPEKQASSSIETSSGNGNTIEVNTQDGPETLATLLETMCTKIITGTKEGMQNKWYALDRFGIPMQFFFASLAAGYTFWGVNNFLGDPMNPSLSQDAINSVSAGVAGASTFVTAFETTRMILNKAGAHYAQDSIEQIFTKLLKEGENSPDQDDVEIAKTKLIHNTLQQLSKADRIDLQNSLLEDILQETQLPFSLKGFLFFLLLGSGIFASVNFSSTTLSTMMGPGWYYAALTGIKTTLGITLAQLTRCVGLPGHTANLLTAENVGALNAGTALIPLTSQLPPLASPVAGASLTAGGAFIGKGLYEAGKKVLGGVSSWWTHQGIGYAKVEVEENSSRQGNRP